MAQMNREWAIGKLKEFLDTAALTYVADASNTVGFWHYRLTNPTAEVQAAAQIVEQILDRVITDWRTAEWEQPPKQPMWRHREAPLCQDLARQLGASGSQQRA